MVDIDKLRKQTGLSINEFSALLNVHRDTFGKWKRQERSPDQAAIRLFKIIEWLNNNDLLDKCIDDINSSS